MKRMGGRAAPAPAGGDRVDPGAGTVIFLVLHLEAIADLTRRDFKNSR